MRQHGLDLDTARKVILQGMLADQPLPLQGASRVPAEARVASPS